MSAGKKSLKADLKPCHLDVKEELSNEHQPENTRIVGLSVWKKTFYNTVTRSGNFQCKAKLSKISFSCHSQMWCLLNALRQGVASYLFYLRLLTNGCWLHSLMNKK
ncbi:hypothetical protein AVEN_223175-1 [Araneus ventricosus]|uniref:Uncharacterized protein n=1 Tax=Araneus ventricosus TaxID=182803 RepID=A0A4Y2FS39_ARAVE|nr:hypothetical protein AVEN_223175-1 [Araneus ventricosus]